MEWAQLTQLIVVTWAAGLAMPFGALLGFIPHIQPRWLEREFRHGIIALGAGALLSAVALVLVPEGVVNHTVLSACIFFVLGALAFMALDIFLARQKTRASQLAAMLADFIPESIAIGASAALGKGTLLLAALIFVQNFPEGFNAFREMQASEHKNPKRIVWLFVLMACLGPVFALTGYFWLSQFSWHLSAIMLFAAGGILYSVLQDIAPQIRIENNWLPPLGGIIGFLIGMLGYILEKQ